MRHAISRLLIVAAALIFSLQTQPAWALSQSCNAPNTLVSFTNSAPDGTTTGTIQSSTVPAGVTSVTIDAAGAQGGQAFTGSFGGGGKGAEVAATVPVTPGQVLCVLVGGIGGVAGGNSGGGGGGSFVYVISSGTCTSNLAAVTAGSTAPKLLVAAGGGGGGGGNSPAFGNPGRATGLGAGTAGALSGGDANFIVSPLEPHGLGGTGGQGGSTYAGEGGGGGLLTGGQGCGGAALINGGNGGSCGGNGGFGGGGGEGGGGGGYNGGGGESTGAGGGGSFSAVTPLFAQSNRQTSNGQVNLCYPLPSSSTALISSLNPSTSGQSVTFTATVSSGGGTPTGTVTFLDGGGTLGTGTLSGGVATFTTAALGAGTHSITAQYGGNSSFLGSTSSTLTQTVNQAPAITSASSTTLTFGAAGTFTVTTTGFPAPALGETGALPSGVQFTDNGNGTATLSGTPAAAGSFPLSITAANGFAPDAQQSFSLTVNKANQTITGLSAAPGDAKVGGTTYTPSASASSGLAVTFGASGACSYSGGAVHFTSAGTCTVSADQAGNANFNAAPTVTQPFSVAKGDTTTTVITSGSPTPIGQAVTFTATVSGGDSLTPPGTVTFKDGASTIGTGTLSSGQATFQTSSLSVGSHNTITASYDGNSNFNGSASSNLAQQVDKISSAGIVRSFFSPSTFGDSVTLSALVSGTSGGTPTGSVQFMAGASALGSAVAVNTLGVGYPIAAGFDYTCALTAVGGVKCWGLNNTGQLGSTANTVPNPTPLDTGLSGVVAIASGSSHSCALTAAGNVKCWGLNQYGELGSSVNNGTLNPNPTPIDTGLSGVVAIAVGSIHSCALTVGGGVKCWGNNSFGQLGTTTNSGTDDPNPTPLDTGLSGVVAIAAGSAHTCALTAAGSVKCWGWNNTGQLGTSTNAGTDDPNPVPIDVGLSDVVAIASGTGYNCALTAAGGLKCWGNNRYGQLGSSANNGTSNPNSTPIDAGVSGIVAVAAGFGHTCALTSAGGMKCWGYNTYGQLASSINAGTENANPTPQDTGLSGVAAITAGNVQSCALTVAGGIKCWGRNYYGELGSTTNNLALNPNSTPLDVTDFGDGAAQVFGKATLATAALTAGSHDITAAYGGDGNHDGSTSGVLTQTVNKANQTISFTSMAPVGAKFGGSYNPAATATSGLTVTLGASGACSLSGGTVSFNSVGACTVTADQGGNGNYNAASQATQNFSIGKAGQTVSFTSARPHPKVGDTYTPAATATSGLIAAFGASGACSFAAGKVTFNVAGACTVTANQGGDPNYNAATQATQSIPVGKAATTLTASAAPAAVKPEQAVTVTARITAPAGVTPSGSVTFKEGGKFLGSGTVAAKKASASVSGLTIGSHVITAQYSGDSNLTQSSATTTVTVSAKVGAETQVNTTTTGTQQAPAVAVLKSGHVVVWQSNGQDGAGFGIYGQRFNAAGAKAGAELHISTATVGNQMLPKAAGLTAGGFVVVWQSQNQDTSGYGIYGQRFSAAGAKSGVEFKVNTTTSGDQTLPAVAATSDGGFVVAWTSNGQDGSGLGIYAQRYDSKGKPAGTEFKVNKTTAGDQSNPAIAGFTAGGFVVTWQGPDASGLGIFAQRYDGGGNAVGNQLAVNRTATNDQALPAIAALATGGFVIAWQSTDASGLGVYVRRYDSQARPIGGDVLINTTTVNDQGTPAVAGFSDGGYVIAWTSNLQDGSGQGVYAQAYTDDGARVNTEFPVNTTTADNQNQPATAAFASGNFVVVWTSANDGGGQGIYSQRFLVPGTN